MPGEWKYGVRGHNPRCACPDCESMFRTHNRVGWCACGDCAAHREIGAPAPPTTSYEDYQENQWEARQGRGQYGNRWYTTPTAQTAMKREADRMSTIHMCSRPGCNSIIKRDALGLMSVQPSMDDEQINHELCPDCVRDVWELLNTEPKAGTRQRAYDKPFRPDDEPSKEDDRLVDEAALGKAIMKLLADNGLNAKAIEGAVHDGRTIIDGNTQD